MNYFTYTPFSTLIDCVFTPYPVSFKLATIPKTSILEPLEPKFFSLYIIMWAFEKSYLKKKRFKFRAQPFIMQRRTQTSRLLLFNLHSILAVRIEALHCILPSLSSPCIHLLLANTDGPRSHTSHTQPTCQRRTRAALQTFKIFPTCQFYWQTEV